MFGIQTYCVPNSLLGSSLNLFLFHVGDELFEVISVLQESKQSGQFFVSNRNRWTCFQRVSLSQQGNGSLGN